MGWFMSGLFVCLCFGVLREVRVFAIRPEEALRGFKGRGELLCRVPRGILSTFLYSFSKSGVWLESYYDCNFGFFFAAHITTENGHFKISTTTASISTKFCADKTVFGEEQ